MMRALFVVLAAAVCGLLMVIAAQISSIDAATTDFMAFLASRPLATLPLGGGDLLVAVQSSVSKQVPGNTYGQVAAANTWTKSNAVTSAVLTPGAGTIAVNAALSNGFTLTIGNDSNVLGNPSNITAGQTLDFMFTVGSGGHTGFSTDTNYKVLTSGSPALTWSTAAGKVDAMYCKAWTTTFLDCSAKIDVH